jgi:hypothetical protein
MALVEAALRLVMPAKAGIQYAVWARSLRMPQTQAFTGLPAFAGNDD